MCSRRGCDQTEGRHHWVGAKDSSKRLSTQVEIDSQAAVSRIHSEHERDGDSKALRNATICQAVLRNCVPEALCSLPQTIDVVAGSD